MHISIFDWNKVDIYLNIKSQLNTMAHHAQSSSALNLPQRGNTGDVNTIHGGIFLSSSKNFLIGRLKFRALLKFLFSFGHCCRLGNQKSSGHGSHDRQWLFLPPPG